MAYAFYLGVDISDEETGPTATISIVEKEADDPDDPARYHVRTIERTDHLAGDDEEDPHNDFAALADRVQELLTDDPQVGRTIPAVNATGSWGQGAVQAFTARGLSPVGITVTGGEGAAQSGSGLSLEGGDSAADDDAGFFVSEADLAGRLVALEERGRLTIEQESTRYASDLAHGLQSWRTRVDTTEQTEEAEALGEELAAEVEEDEPVEADGEPGKSDVATTADETAPSERATDEKSAQASRSGAHTPFVVSAGLACWLGEERSFDPTVHLGGEAPTTGEAKRMHRSDTAS